MTTQTASCPIAHRPQRPLWQRCRFVLQDALVSLRDQHRARRIARALAHLSEHTLRDIGMQGFVPRADALASPFDAGPVRE